MGNKLESQRYLIGNLFYYFFLIINRIDDIDTDVNDVRNNAEKANGLLDEEGVNKRKKIIDKRTYFIIALIFLVIIIIAVFIILTFD